MGRNRSKTPKRRSTKKQSSSEKEMIEKAKRRCPSLRAMLQPFAESDAGPRFFDEFRTPILDYFFKYFPFLGNEIQYVLLLPFASWILDASFLQRLTLSLTTRWFLSVFAANCAKDILCLKRCGPVSKRLTHDVDDQFGFPSTHSAAAISISIPLLAFLCRDEIDCDERVWLGSFAYTIIVATSRLYLGVHSVADTLGGILVGLLSVTICDYIVDDLASAVANSENTALVVVCTLLFTFVVCKIYPDARVNNTCYLEVLAVCGLLVGGIIAETTISNVSPCYVTQHRPVAIMLSGLLVLYFVRHVTKTLSIMLARNLGLDASFLYVFEHATIGAFVIAAPTTVLGWLAGC